MVTTAEMQKKIVETIEKVAPGSEIYLFGSRARGDARPDSDWDVLILVDVPNIRSGIENSLLDVLYDLEVDTSTVISPLVYSKAEWRERYRLTPLYENIEREGVHWG